LNPGRPGAIVATVSHSSITRIAAMAKSGALIIKMLSTADTGFYYVTKKNPRGVKTEKLALKKYDPIARKHVVFKEGKIK
jgi:large subunit ribosomal protein L33